jgi:hypothetical protein
MDYLIAEGATTCCGASVTTTFRQRRSSYFGNRSFMAVAPSSSQWIFPVSALSATPSIAMSKFTLEKELYDRSRGAEFLFRLGTSLGLSVAVVSTPKVGLYELIIL